jgi:iron complex outermembrane receptor protein
MKKIYFSSLRSIASFKMWSNKNYAVFNSLKSVVKIGVLASTYTLVAQPMATFAQTDSVGVSKNVDMDEVVIGGRKKATTYSEQTRAVMVITKDELGALPASTLGDLLEHVAGVDIRQRGGHGVQADLMVRGGTFDQVLILLNGINITDPQTGHHNLNIPIDYDAIDRIEVLHGPGARVYGQGAFSGAINIITIPKNDNEINASILIGEHGLLKTGTTINHKGKRFSTKIAASTAKSNGYTANTDFNSVNFFTHSKIAALKGQLDLQAGIQDKGFGAQAFYTPKFPEQFEKTSTLFASEAYSLTLGNFTVNHSAYFRKHYDRFELFRRNSPVWYTSHNYHTTNVAGATLGGNFDYGIGKFRFGGEFRHESILSTNLGDILMSPVKVKGEDSIYYTKGKFRNWGNIFIENSFYVNDFSVSAGGMVTFGQIDKPQISWGADLGYNLTQNIKVFASANSTFRAPNFTDLYYTGPTNEGNPNLKPEKAITYEFGVKNQTLKTSSSILAFFRDGKDVIDWVKFTPEQIKWTTYNYTNISSYGFEASFSHIFTKTNPLISSCLISYSYTETNRESGEVISYYALDYLKHKVTVSANHKVWNKLYFNWLVIAQSRAGTYTDFVSNTEKEYSPFAMVNTKITWNDRHFSVFADIQNITNKKYFDIGNIPQPNRWISAGASFTIK